MTECAPGGIVRRTWEDVEREVADLEVVLAGSPGRIDRARLTALFEHDCPACRRCAERLDTLYWLRGDDLTVDAADV